VSAATTRPHVRLAHTVGDPWRRVILEAEKAGPRGTMRAWFQARHDAWVYTLQATGSADGEVWNIWTPGLRQIDSAARAGAVSLGGSWRDYAGTRVLAATDDVLVIVAPFGDDVQVAVYATVEAAAQAA
jgi:hypothetical protein